MKGRIQRLRKELEKRGLDAFLAVRNVRYIAGTSAGKAVVVPLGGDPILICSRLEFEQAKLESSIRDIRAFSAWKAPLQSLENVYFGELWQLLAHCLRDFGSKAVGHDGGERGLMRKLRNAYPVSYRELPELMLELRKIKSKEEITLLRRSAKIAMGGMNCAAESIVSGRTELEIAADVEHEMRRAGSEGTPFPTIVASGRNSILPHARATQRRLRRGELIIVDIGAIYKGYASDITRTFSISPSEKQLKLIHLVRRAQGVAIAKIRNGVKANVIDTAARRIISRAGYAKFSPHGTGHGLGLEIHEPPNLSPNSKDVLHENMVLTVEPGVYVPELGGARWEDMVLTTKMGYQMLTEL